MARGHNKRITLKEWRFLGGRSNPRLHRTMRGRRWHYYLEIV